MKNIFYSFKENSLGLYPVDAQTIGEELDEIKKNHGGKCTPKDVVEVAKNPRNPLHECIEWDNQKAGDKYREQQARQLIGSIVVTFKQHEEVRANYSVKFKVNENKEERAYVSVKEATSGEYDEQFTDNFYNDLKAIVKRYQVFPHLQKEVHIINKLVFKHESEKEALKEVESLKI